MQPLYTRTEFRKATSRQPLPLSCLQCTKTFYQPKNLIQITLAKRNTSHTLCFCSTSCENIHRNPPVTLSCEQCHVSFKRSPCHVRQSKHHFCCRSCAAKWNNANKTKGTRVSKLETWLAKILPGLYPGLDFHFNRRDAINGELDIFIPSLKLAFELNGVFHYIPIYGPEKLAAMRNNDARKVQACLEHGIELCVIDVSRQKYFKEQRALEFLPIVTAIINSKLPGSSPATTTA